MSIVLEEKWLHDENFIVNKINAHTLYYDASMLNSCKKCPLCFASYSDKQEGILCTICLTSEVGVVTLGKKIME